MSTVAPSSSSSSSTDNRDTNTSTGNTVNAATCVAERKFLVLSLDGGGMRAVITLMILKAVEKALQKRPGYAQQSLVKCFDLIAGTSAGGLLALALGRKHLTIDECFAVFDELKRDAFATKASIVASVLPSLHQVFYPRDALYEHSAFEKLLKKYFGAEEPLHTNELPRVFVTTQVASRNSMLRGLRLLRTYAAPTYDGGRLVVASPTTPPDMSSCYTWQAARATTAGQTYFAPIKIGDDVCEDGGFGCNNPAYEAWWEAQHVARALYPNVLMSYFVLSVGTGSAPERRNGNLVHMMADMLTSAAAVDGDMQTVASCNRNQTTYLRLNAALHRQIELSDVDVVDQLVTAVQKWLGTEDTKRRVEAVVDQLVV